jgi:hypothetical protein
LFLIACQFVLNQVLNLVDHATDAIVVFMLLGLANPAETESFNNLSQVSRLTDQAAVLGYNYV